MTCRFIIAESQYVKCSTFVRVSPWPSESMATRFAREVRSELANWAWKRELVVMKLWAITRVDLEGSIVAGEVWYAAVMPPRCGTWMVWIVIVDNYIRVLCEGG